MDSLTKCPNIGKVLKEKLYAIGIDSRETLISQGSENTFVMLLAHDPTICINHLYALEGAVKDMRWHQLSKSRKLELQKFYNTVVLK